MIGSEAANLIRDRILLRIDEFCSIKTRTRGKESDFKSVFTALLL